MRRYLFALASAAIVAVSLFYLMQYLISGNHSRLSLSQSQNTIDIIRLKPSEELVTKQRRLPEPPEQPVIPIPPSQPVKSLNEPQLVSAKLALPATDITAVNINRALLKGISPETSAPGENNDVIALLKVEPNYPRKAARQGIEGWVKLGFTVLEDGTVTSVDVIDADPKRIFDKSAKRAIMKWKFKPKIVNGKAVKQQAIQVIEFKLQK